MILGGGKVGFIDKGIKPSEYGVLKSIALFEISNEKAFIVETIVLQHKQLQRGEQSSCLSSVCFSSICTMPSDWQ